MMNKKRKKNKAVVSKIGKGSAKDKYIKIINYQLLPKAKVLIIKKIYLSILYSFIR